MGRSGDLRGEIATGFFKKKEKRAEGTLAFDDALLSALLGKTKVTREMATQIPTAAGCVNKLAGTVSQLPIKLYRREKDRVAEIFNDPRLKALNDDTGDTLNANEFWKAIIEDYFFGKGGFAYIRKEKGKFSGLCYVDEREISLQINNDPIFKDYNIMVRGQNYRPDEFFKIKRKTRNGAESIPIQTENPLLFSVAYSSLLYEEMLVKKGGNKRGFIEAESRLTEESIASIKEAWKNMYSNNTDNIVVLNNGAHFKESSNTSVEMQLNENKRTNAEEMCKLFGFSARILTGGATEEDRREYISRVSDLLTAIETALDRDLLLEREKGSLYFAFDTKELTRGNQRDRFEAYKTALEANFMQIDEIREAEDLEPLGLNWIKLGLKDVLYDPKTKVIYTPNTGEIGVMEERPLEPEPEDSDQSAEEYRAGNPYHGTDGRFTSAPGGGLTGGKKSNKIGKTKYAPSPQRNKGGIQLTPKTYARLAGTLNTRFPGLEAGEIRKITDAKYRYTVETDGYGGFRVLNKKKI